MFTNNVSIKISETKAFVGGKEKLTDTNVIKFSDRKVFAGQSELGDVGMIQIIGNMFSRIAGNRNPELFKGDLAPLANQILSGMVVFPADKLKEFAERINANHNIQRDGHVLVLETSTTMKYNSKSEYKNYLGITDNQIVMFHFASGESIYDPAVNTGRMWTKIATSMMTKVAITAEDVIKSIEGGYFSYLASVAGINPRYLLSPDTTVNGPTKNHIAKCYMYFAGLPGLVGTNDEPYALAICIFLIRQIAGMMSITATKKECFEALLSIKYNKREFESIQIKDTLYNRSHVLTLNNKATAWLDMVVNTLQMRSTSQTFYDTIATSPEKVTSASTIATALFKLQRGEPTRAKYSAEIISLMSED